uniref:Uncharacterized protein n=1 Tax=viral metagenome TaxID=1070528 RepID=A0A6C0FHW0_9ZZZZ|tara:strand:- start:15071 stop:15307 length:237 start_codon:yes stop_codon:yes gene_type:complete
MSEIELMREELREMREMLIEIRDSSKNMDSHIGFINGIYESYRASLDFLRDVFEYSRNLVISSTLPLVESERGVPDVN